MKYLNDGEWKCETWATITRSIGNTCIKQIYMLEKTEYLCKSTTFPSSITPITLQEN